MYAKNRAFFYNTESVVAMRTLIGNKLIMLFPRFKSAGADGALKLPFTTVVIVEIIMRSTTSRAYSVSRNVTLRITTNSNRFNQFTVAFMKVSNEFFVVVFFRFEDDRRSINLEFLIFRRV